VREEIRADDPARLTVPMPDPAFGEAMEIDYGRLGMWTDPVCARRRTVWAFRGDAARLGAAFRAAGAGDGPRCLAHLPP